MEVRPTQPSASTRRTRSSSVVSLPEASAKPVEAKDKVRQESREERDPLCRIRELKKDLTSYLLAEQSKVSKAAGEKILGLILECEETVVDVVRELDRAKAELRENRRWETKIASGGITVSRGTAEALPARTTAPTVPTVPTVPATPAITVAVNSRAPAESPAEPQWSQVVRRRKSYAVVVSDPAGKMDNEALKKKLISEVGPTTDIRVRAIRKCQRQGAIVIETMSENECVALKESEALKKMGMNVEDPRKRGTRVLVFDVPTGLSDGDMLKEIYSKNVKEVIGEDDFRKKSRIISRHGKGEVRGNVILELPENVKVALLKVGRVFINWDSCKVREVDAVDRCYQCQQLGHIARHCPVKERLCGKCGEPGHVMKDCRGKEKCRMCAKKGVNAEHSIRSEKCPEYARMVQRVKNRNGQ
ncbi:hypothetical protein WA026_010215 [Henosepilachna vigintioctopunctata]|uniref:CCHC-type domain-containing protein n=1 Tax=Henosepilachna vigintioctopunctata TaxID=420089 RepID=A0AAW1UCR4_9CUCU